ncbi:hypothetical protein Tco_0620610 [Tanacetum coccineum]
MRKHVGNKWPLPLYLYDCRSLIGFDLKANKEHASLLDDFREFDRARLDIEEGGASQEQSLLKERATLMRTTGQLISLTTSLITDPVPDLLDLGLNIEDNSAIVPIDPPASPTGPPLPVVLPDDFNITLLMLPLSFACSGHRRLSKWTPRLECCKREVQKTSLLETTKLKYVLLDNSSRNGKEKKLARKK